MLSAIRRFARSVALAALALAAAPIAGADCRAMSGVAPEGMACCAKSHGEPLILPQCCQMQAPPAQAPDHGSATPAQQRAHDARPGPHVPIGELVAPHGPTRHPITELTHPQASADRLHIRLGVIRR
jgi:hypothetical protein